MGFIYKITNIISNKCYIGETKEDTPEKRWQGHIQSIKRNAGCPALKDAIKKYGIEKFKFEVLIICFDEDRFIYEKEYIKKYNSQVPNGYNILPGGEGGGFLGKNHSEETRKKIGESGKAFRQNNPNHFETYREKHKEAMKQVDISAALKNSEKFKRAVEERRIGGKILDETKKKISESVIRYLNNNREKHRDAITRAIGKKIAQYTKDNVFVKEYISIAEAGRTSSVKGKTIQNALSGRNKTAGGFIWKYVNNNQQTT
jgi:group I intron endonuclease